MVIRSFGDGLDDLVDGEEGLEPPSPTEGLPQLRFALVPVLDEDALAAACEQVREAVTQAVLDGFRDAMAGMVLDDGTPPAPAEVPFDPNPTLNEADRFAYAKYAEMLDREVPDWWQFDVEMAPALAAEARRRRDAALRAGGR